MSDVLVVLVVFAFSFYWTGASYVLVFDGFYREWAEKFQRHADQMRRVGMASLADKAEKDAERDRRNAAFVRKVKRIVFPWTRWTEGDDE